MFETWYFKKVFKTIFNGAYSIVAKSMTFILYQIRSDDDIFKHL
jgi:hypothetical protein